MTELIIATWNIAGGRPMKSSERFDYAAEEIGYFADELRKINPDIICLQETHLNDERSVSRDLCEILADYHREEVSMSPSHVDEQYHLGNAILSKEIPKRVENIPYPDPRFPLTLPGGKPAIRHAKGFQAAYLGFGTIINTQMLPLAYLGTPYNALEGKSFAGEMENVLLSHPAEIICGDLNYTDAKTLYVKLLKEKVNALPDAPTRPGGKKTDYIFVPESCNVISSGIVETNTDHYLCWAKISI